MVKLVVGGLSKTAAEPVRLRCPACRHAGVFHTPLPDQMDIAWTLIDQGRRMGHGIAGIRICPGSDCRAVVFLASEDDGDFEVYPPEVIDFDASALPPQILSSLEEALLCHSAGAFKAAALMVRRVLEELCEDRGAKGKDLNTRLADLGSGAVVPPELLEAAHELRLLGNDAAHVHAKSYDEVGKEEAEIAIELAKELLKAVYQYASLLGRLKGLKKPRT